MRIVQTSNRLAWKLAPFLRLLLPVLAGMTVQKFFPLNGKLLLLPCLFFCVLSLYFLLRKTQPGTGREYLCGFVLQMAFYFLGCLLLYLHRDIQVEQSACWKTSDAQDFIIEILSDPVAKKKGSKCTGEIRWLAGQKICYREKEKVLLYFGKMQPSDIRRGVCIIVRKTLRPIVNTGKPDFDYAGFCHRRHIYAQVYLNASEYGFVGYADQSRFFLLDSLRQKILKIIKKHIPQHAENSFLEALLVGFTDDLDPALLASYADTGVIHIIAISGLHLALICHLLQLALKRIGQHQYSSYVKLILVVSLLWAYSFLSGASPPVIRSAMMFTLALTAKNLVRDAVLFNTLAASAFLLLCFDPDWLWDTGFQLSYAAVLSLGIFSKPIVRLVRPQNILLSKLWEACSVSIAAQILTVPVSIYYFHRFPTYFLIANLVAVPLSSVILITGIALSLLCWIPPLAYFLGWVTGLLIEVLNAFIHHVSTLPAAVIAGLYLSLFQVVMLYAFIFLFYKLTGSRKQPV